MNLNEYQDKALETSTYPCGKGVIGFTEVNLGLLYCALKLAGEAGEVAEKIGKLLRDKEGKISNDDRLAIAKELGDVLWYIASLAHELDFTLHTIAVLNNEKLAKRKASNTLKGEGDDR